MEFFLALLIIFGFIILLASFTKDENRDKDKIKNVENKSYKDQRDKKNLTMVVEKDSDELESPKLPVVTKQDALEMYCRFRGGINSLPDELFKNFQKICHYFEDNGDKIYDFIRLKCGGDTEAEEFYQKWKKTNYVFNENSSILGKNAKNTTQLVNKKDITGIYGIVRVYSNGASELLWELDYKRISVRIERDYEGDWTVNIIYADLKPYEVNYTDKYQFMKYENEYSMLIYACIQAIYLTQGSESGINRLCMISPDQWIRENVLERHKQIIKSKQLNVYVKTCGENDNFGVIGTQLRGDSWMGEQPQVKYKISFGPDF